MRFFLTIVLFFTSLIVVAQVDSIELKNVMQKLDKALLEKDSLILTTILHKDVCYGHSNGWIQTKKNLWDDFVSGKLVYKKIENNNTTIVAINKKWATVKTNTAVEGTVNDKSFNMTLHVLQVWLKTKKGWQLVARQSAKL
ncbi:MAG TPA: nuclear transport factor 2 family protein [Chitinophagaceae bacterium]|nr:nuclear transport factor 2 family protein [Chitinophagaceae bacterium]